MTREEQKAFNAENYPASVLTWMNEATDRAYNIFEKIRVCRYCKYYNSINELSGLCEQEALPPLGVDEDFGCNKWEKKEQD